jgi:hypothetical protein
MATAMGLRNEVMFIALQLRNCPIAQWANHFFWQKCYEIITFSLNLFFLNAPSHDKTIA